MLKSLNLKFHVRGTKYSSIVGYRKGIIVQDGDEKVKALDIIVSKYVGKSNLEYLNKEIDKLYIIKVKIDNITGKRSGY